MLNNNISESLISLLTQSSQQSSLNFPSQPQQVSLKQMEALAMSLLHTSINAQSNIQQQGHNVDNTRGVKAVSQAMPNQSPRDHITQSVFPQMNAQMFPMLRNQNKFSTAPSHIGPQQYNSLRNNPYNSATSNKPPQTQFPSKNNGNSSLNQRRQRDQDPRKMRQQQQFSANKERTIYISEVHPDTTEADIAILFSECGEVADCRLCGDAHSKMRFAFVEFSALTWMRAVTEALKLNNSFLCGARILVQRSKTAIVPIKRDLLPQNEDEMIRCARTVYVCNIDKRFNKMDLQNFFETLAVDESLAADGRVSRIKMMGDSNQKTNIAFVEFFSDASTTSAINKCQGALMGCLPLRIFASKTPIRSPEEERELKKARYAALLNQK